MTHLLIWLMACGGSQPEPAPSEAPPSTAVETPPAPAPVAPSEPLTLTGTAGRSMDPDNPDAQLAGASMTWYPVVHASSTLDSEDGRYGPEKLVDKKPVTAWVEGAEGAGTGQKLELFPEDSIAWPTELAMIPGMAASEERWSEFTRPKTVALHLHSELTVGVATAKLHHKVVLEVEQDHPALKPVFFATGPLCEALHTCRAAVKKLELEVLEVWPGSREDLAISELVLY